MNFTIAAHVGFVNGVDSFGLTSHVIEYLKSNKQKYLYIKHCLHGKDQSQIETESFEVKVGISRFHNAHIFLRTLENVLINVNRIYSSILDDIIFIGINPVNSISGAILKYTKRIKRNIYICADFADNRFNNIILNFAYHLFDRIALNCADEIWCVSSRIKKKRIEQGVPKNKLRLLPNSPYFASVPKVSHNKNHNLIVVTHLNKSFDLGTILNIIEILSREGVSLTLTVVGFGPEECRLKKMTSTSSISKLVRFTGHLSHKEVLDEISKSFLGIALYTSENPWNYYGDSMKAREYAAAGIPLIINSIPSTSDEVLKYNAGLVTDESTSITEICDFIKKCIYDQKYYLKLRNNAKTLGKAYDKKAILDYLFKKYI